MMIRVITVVLLLPLSVFAQTCPTSADAEKGLDAAEPSTLHGELVYHDELRQWIGVKLEKPACGQEEIQLVFTEDSAWRRAESLRGCSLTVKGKIFDSPTGYYSADLAISNALLRPDSTCHPFAITPDLSKVAIPSRVAGYRVSITVDYRGKGHVSVRVTDGPSGTTALEPWQAYAHYSLTSGADVIWFGCQKAFRLEGAKQQPPTGEILPGDDDAGASLQNVEGANTITYSCKRKQMTW